MDLSNEFSCEAGSLSRHCHTHRFLQPEVLRLYFPALEPWVLWSVWLPSCSSQFIHMNVGPPDLPAAVLPTSVCQLLPHPPSPSATALLRVLSAWLPISAPPTSLDECFYVNFLVVRLPYSLIFWQLWLFFVFQFVIVRLLVV